MGKMAEAYRPTPFTCRIYGSAAAQGRGFIELATWLEWSHG